jgi:hypothetical protein
MSLTLTVPADWCRSGKIKYETAEAAVSAADGFNRRGGEPCHPYRCPECDSFHIGRQNPRRSRFRRTLR